MPILLAERNNKELRRAISDITKQDDPASIREQPARIKALRGKYPHSIDPVCEPAGMPDYNCVRYAFDLINLPDPIRLAVDHIYGRDQLPGTGPAPRINPLGTLFVNFLIERGALHERNDDESRGVIVYLDRERVRHIGKMHGKLVRSKWGCKGHLWEHRAYEVPTSFGDDVLVFKSLPRDEVIQRLSVFMEEVRNADGQHKRKCLLESLHHWPIL